MDIDIKIGIIQLSSNDNLKDNCRQLEYYFNQCVEKGANFILSPEVSNFISTDNELRNKTLTNEKEDPMIHLVKKLCKKFTVWCLIGSTVLKIKKDKFVNRSILINENGRIVSKYDKIHMFDVKINCKETYFESKFFKPGRELVLVKTPFANIGLSICYDVRFPYLFSALKNCGADIICVPSAFTVKTGKDHWETLLKARAIENQIFIIAPAQCGQNTSSRKTWGHSVIIDPNGKILCDLGNKIDYDVIQLKNH